MKLLYFTDRQWLVKRGVTIFEDDFYSMDEGPVLSETYNSMKQPSKGEVVGAIWRRSLSPISNETIRKKNTLDPSQYLTRSQLGVLESVWNEYGHLSKDEIVDRAHKLPEWIDPHGTSQFIMYKTVLECELEDPEEVRTKTRSAMTQQRISQAFGL